MRRPGPKRQDADAAVNAIALPDGHFCWVALMAVVANVETLGALNRTITRARSDEAKVAAVTQRDQRVRTWVMPDAETPASAAASIRSSPRCTPDQGA
jgi:hypothetical protein